MKVERIMTPGAKSCMPEQPLSNAVQIMWNHDCGIVPVVDEDGRAIGVLTDRDICIACWSHDARPGELSVGDTMSRDVKTCGAADTVQVAEQIMQENQIRRLPVVDADGRLVGILSLNDIAREAEREREAKTRRKEVRPETVLEALAAVCQPRMARQQTSAAM